MGEIGLFPLGVVLLPGERIPLHIFEPRYKELIGECLELGVPFGLVLADESGMREVGTEASVVDVLRRFEDGRLDVVVEGRERFRLVEPTDGRSFATAEIEELPDEADAPAAEQIERCLAAYRRLVTEANAEPTDFAPDADLAYVIGAHVGFGAEAKQSILELRSERARIVRVAELLEAASGHIRQEREIRDRAATNGRVERP